MTEPSLSDHWSGTNASGARRIHETSPPSLVWSLFCPCVWIRMKGDFVQMLISIRVLRERKRERGKESSKGKFLQRQNAVVCMFVAVFLFIKAIHPPNERYWDMWFCPRACSVVRVLVTYINDGRRIRPAGHQTGPIRMSDRLAFGPFVRTGRPRPRDVRESYVNKFIRVSSYRLHRFCSFVLLSPMKQSLTSDCPAID